VSVIDERLEAQRLAYLELAEYSKAVVRRNELIVRSVDAGISPATVAVVVGLSRQHVYAILKKMRARQAARDAS
jgi:CRP-like cAMP-binding protein